MGHVTRLESIADICGPKAIFESYHIHVLFWPSNSNSTAAAIELRKSFANEFQVTQDCPISPADPAPRQRTICAFPVDMEPKGPFLTGQWSFFIPLDYFAETTAYIMQHRGTLDSFIHPNSGCTTDDHTTWSLWGGSQWELDTSIFSA